MPVQITSVSRLVFGAAALVGLAAFLFAQSPIGADELSLHAAPYSPAAAFGVIRTQVELVEVPTVVRDSKGVAVAGLKREDFELFDEGKKQDISAFSVETFPRAGTPGKNPPSVSAPAGGTAQAPESHSRYIALVIDDLNTDAASLHRGKTAAGRFVAEALAPGDLVGIFTTALSQKVEFTANADALRQAIEAVTMHTRYSDDLYTCPVIRAYEAYLIANYLDPALLDAKAAEAAHCYHISSMDSARRMAQSKAGAVWMQAEGNTRDTLRSLGAIVSAIGKMPGQRLVLLASSGFVSADAAPDLEALSRVALHSGVIVSGIDLRGLYPLVPGGDAATPALARGMHPAEIAVQAPAEDAKDHGMEELATATGGRLFHSNNDLDLGFRRLGAVPEVLYVLGFAPGDAARDGKYHPLKVRLAGGLHGSVEARVGYNAMAKATPANSPPTDRDGILLGADQPSDIAARIDAEPGTSDTGPRVVTKAWIDVTRLNFETKHGRRTQQLTMTAALLDHAGNFVVGRQAVAALALKAHSFEALSASGLTVSLSLHAPPGEYTLRVLLQESLSGKMTAVSDSIRLP
jgi:VWFA-related protein